MFLPPLIDALRQNNFYCIWIDIGYLSMTLSFFTLLQESTSVANYQSIITELEAVIGDAKTLMACFEATGFDETLSDDYLALHELYARMVEEQRRYTQEMLAAEE